MAKSKDLTLDEVSKKLVTLSETIKLDYSFTANANPNIPVSQKESELVLKLEDQIKSLQARLDKKIKSAIPSFITHKEKEKLKSKIVHYQQLKQDVQFIESTLNSIKTIIDSHGSKIEAGSKPNSYAPIDPAKAQLIKKLNTTIEDGIKRLKKSGKDIDNPDIKILAKNYLEALEKVNDLEVKHDKKPK